MAATGRTEVLIGAVLLAALAAAAAAAPWLAPGPPGRQELTRRLEGPSPGHPLGHDELGRDILARLLHGARISLAAGLAVVILSAAAGTLLGGLAGYAGGRADTALVAVVDLLLGFPGILLAVALTAILGPRFQNVVLALAAIGWVAYARLARALVLRLKALPLTVAAVAIGARTSRLFLRHLLPQLLAPVMAQAALGFGGVMLAEAGLSFLGIGVPQPAPSWGSMLRSGSQNLLDAPHLAIAPGGAIFLAVLGANLLGEGLAARLDPRRTRGAREDGPGLP